MVPTLNIVVGSDSLHVASPIFWAPGAYVDPSAGYVVAKLEK